MSEVQGKKNIFARIEEQRANFTGKQEKLADYLLANYKTAAFCNSTKLAKLAGVSGSTVIRFAEVLEYEGFPQMQAALHVLVQKEINNVDAFLSKSGSSEQIGVGRFFKPCLDSLRKVEQSLPVKKVDEAAEILSKARNVYVVGFQGSAFLAEFTAYYLSKIRPHVHRVNEWENSFFSLLTEDGQEQDVALIYAFPRFPMLTERLVRFFKQRGVQMIAISTVYENPLSREAKTVVPVDIEYHAYVDHMTPVLYISEAIIQRVAKCNQAMAVKQLEQFENFAQNAGIFAVTENS